MGELVRESLDDEGLNSLYWEHLLKYELTILRDIFLEEMEKTAPGWIKELEKGAIKADFEEAVRNCDNSWHTKKIKSWLDALETGQIWALRRSFVE